MYQKTFLPKSPKGYRHSPVLLLAAALLFSYSLAQTNYQEAPGLAQQVEAGDLPPLEARLPVNPMVVEPVERIGTYGGTWRMAMVGGDDISLMQRTMGYEQLVRWVPDATEVLPNIAESVETSDEGNAFTFSLREGMKWSDGETFSADDIMFWYEDVLLNEELTPVVPSWLMSGEDVVTVEKLDDYTVRFTFAEPQAFFLQTLATPEGIAPTNHPRHYLETFHAVYNPEGIEALVQAAGLASWTDLYANEADWAQNSARPVLFAWRFTTAYGEGTTRAVAERNPYYFKVDTEGNQLPYIDSLVYSLLESVDVAVLRGLSGELDMQSRRISATENTSVFFDNMERGDYRFYTTIPTNMNVNVLALNLNVNDPVKREVFNNKDFRIGLSHAINRQEIIDLVFVGQTEAWQAAPRPESPFYNERFAKQYSEYDVALANEYLDRVLPQKDAEGWRLGPDGNRFTFTLELSSHNQPRVDVVQLLEPHIRAVGIDMVVRSMDRSLWTTRVEAGEHDATVWAGAGGIDVALEPRWYFPYSMWSHFAPRWAEWFNGDPDGEEPPPAPQRQMELYNQLSNTADQDRQFELMSEILAISADEFYAIGVALDASGWGIVKNNFHNVPESMIDGAAYSTPALTNPEQYFVEAGN